jgi:hypothetical protein
LDIEGMHQSSTEAGAECAQCKYEPLFSTKVESAVTSKYPVNPSIGLVGDVPTTAVTAAANTTNANRMVCGCHVNAA